MSNLKLNYRTVRYIALNLLLGAFVVFYVVDGLYKLSHETIRLGPIVKGGFQLLVLLFALLTLNRAKLNIIVGIFFLGLSFVIGQYYLGKNLPLHDLSVNTNTFFKYIFHFVLFLLAIDILKYKKIPDKLFIFYKTIIIINSLLVFVGFSLKIRDLQTYNSIYRFGYDGLIYAQNEASFVFIFALTTVYYRRFYIKIKEWFFWIVLFSSLLVATKAVYLYFALLFLFHIFTRLPLKKILIFGASMSVMGYAIFSSTINKIFLNSWAVFMYVYNKYGLLHALLSGRNTFISKRLFPLFTDIWVFPNYIFGGQNRTTHLIEMGFFDLFLFFGLFGAFIYLYLLALLIKRIEFPAYLKWFFITALLIIVATAGHFFESAIAGIHFIFLILISKYSKDLLNTNTTEIV